MRICTANKLPGDADGAGPGTPALEPLCSPAPQFTGEGPEVWSSRRTHPKVGPGQAADPVLSCPASSAPFPCSELCSRPNCREGGCRHRPHRASDRLSTGLTPVGEGSRDGEGPGRRAGRAWRRPRGQAVLTAVGCGGSPPPRGLQLQTFVSQACPRQLTERGGREPHRDQGSFRRVIYLGASSGKPADETSLLFSPPHQFSF